MDLRKHVRKVESVEMTLCGLPVKMVDLKDMGLSSQAQSLTLEGFYDVTIAAEAAERILERAQVAKVTLYILRWPYRLFYGLNWCLERVRLERLRYRWCYRRYELDPDRITLEFTREAE